MNSTVFNFGLTKTKNTHTDKHMNQGPFSILFQAGAFARTSFPNPSLESFQDYIFSFVVLLVLLMCSLTLIADANKALFKKRKIRNK